MRIDEMNDEDLKREYLENQVSEQRRTNAKRKARLIEIILIVIVLIIAGLKMCTSRRNGRIPNASTYSYGDNSIHNVLDD